MVASNFDKVYRKDICLKTPEVTIEKTVFLCISVLAMVGSHGSMKMHCRAIVLT